MGENGAKGVEEGNRDPGGVVDFISDDSRKARLFWGRSGGKVHEESGGGGEEGWNTEEPAPFPGREGEGEKSKASEKEGGEDTDGDLAELDHKAENTGEGASFLAGKPSGVNFDHAGGTKRLKPSVRQPNEREGGESSGKGGKTKDEVDGDGANGADEERGATSDAIGEEAVNELAGAVGEGPDGEHVGDLGGGEVKLIDHPRGGKAKVVATHVVGPVEETDRNPVQPTARTKTGGIGRGGGGRAEGHT